MTCLNQFQGFILTLLGRTGGLILNGSIYKLLIGKRQLHRSLGFLWIICVCKSNGDREKNTSQEYSSAGLLGACCGKSEAEVPLSAFHDASTSLLSGDWVSKLCKYFCWPQPERKLILFSVEKEKWTQLDFFRHGMSVSNMIPSSRIFPGLHGAGLCVDHFRVGGSF